MKHYFIICACLINIYNCCLPMIVIVNRPPIMRASDLKRLISQYVQFDRFYAKPVDKSEKISFKFKEAYIQIPDINAARKFIRENNTKPIRGRDSYFWNLQYFNGGWNDVFQFQADIRQQKEDILQFQLQTQQQKHMKFLDYYETQYLKNAGRPEKLSEQRQVVDPNVGVCTFLDFLM